MLFQKAKAKILSFSVAFVLLSVSALRPQIAAEEERMATDAVNPQPSFVYREEFA
jgi:hypothetical protein